MNMQKKSVNLSVDAKLLTRAKARGVNLSALLEQAIQENERQKWLADNAQAFQTYNEYIDQHGVWSDGKREW